MAYLTTAQVLGSTFDAPNKRHLVTAVSVPQNTPLPPVSYPYTADGGMPPLDGSIILVWVNEGYGAKYISTVVDVYPSAESSRAHMVSTADQQPFMDPGEKLILGPGGSQIFFNSSGDITFFSSNIKEKIEISNRKQSIYGQAQLVTFESLPTSLEPSVLHPVMEVDYSGSVLPPLPSVGFARLGIKDPLDTDLLFQGVSVDTLGTTTILSGAPTVANSTITINTTPTVAHVPAGIQLKGLTNIGLVAPTIDFDSVGPISLLAGSVSIDAPLVSVLGSFTASGSTTLKGSISLQPLPGFFSYVGSTVPAPPDLVALGAIAAIPLTVNLVPMIIPLFAA